MECIIDILSNNTPNPAIYASDKALYVKTSYFKNLNIYVLYISCYSYTQPYNLYKYIVYFYAKDLIPKSIILPDNLVYFITNTEINKNSKGYNLQYYKNYIATRNCIKSQYFIINDAAQIMHEPYHKDLFKNLFKNQSFYGMEWSVHDGKLVRKPLFKNRSFYGTKWIVHNGMILHNPMY